MTPYPSFTGPQRRDRARRIVNGLAYFALGALVCIAVLIVAHVALATLAAIPALTDPTLQRF